jgi:hypothetical protein
MYFLLVCHRTRGALVTRVAMEVDVLARLHQQIRQLLIACAMPGSPSRNHSAVHVTPR